MSKSVVLVLESSHEQDYGEYANIPVFNAHGEIIGWTGGEVPEYGYPCEFNALDDEGFTLCASSATINRLRAENDRLLKASEKWMGRAARFEAENAKLRELARDLYHLSDTYFEEREPYWWKPYEQRMRELGIEVDV